MTTTTVATILPAPPQGVQWTTRSLAVVDPSLSIERYQELLYAAGEFKTAASFWIGDLINFGEARYGERYAQAIEATGLSYSTLSNYAYVCRQIPPSRRREALRFSHHAEIASLEPAEQDRWLAEAEKNGWTREQMRDAIKDAAAFTGSGAPLANGSGPAAANGDGGSSRRQEVLEGMEVVEAGRDLGVIREALTKTKEALEGATVVGLEEMLPGAMRALDDVGQTVRIAAAKMAAPALVDAGRDLVRSATRSSGFAMIPDAAFEAFRDALARESSR